MQEILITTEGIKNNLKSVQPLDAICEYIWNGLDANANNIFIDFELDTFGFVSELSIKDDGTGIPYDELSKKFQPFNDSKKTKESNHANHSLPHGRKGIGRLTFFSFADEVKWDTVYEDNGVKYNYFIKMNKSILNEYNDNDENIPSETTKDTGTTVTFKGIRQIDSNLMESNIKKEFFWFLNLYKSKHIYLNGKLLNHNDLVLRRKVITLKEESYIFNIEFVQWKSTLGQEYSKFYFIGSDYVEKYKETTKLNKKTDEFYHSVYINSEYFDEFYFEDDYNQQEGLFLNKKDAIYKSIMKKINDKLSEYRRQFLLEHSIKYIQHLIDKKVYPEFDGSNIVDRYRKKELDNLVETLYIAQPKIFTSLSDENKKVLLYLLNMIMDNGNKQQLFNVLKQVIELEESELNELNDVLQYTTLSNITKTITLLKDRQKVIQGLKEIVFNKELFAKEVPHVQSIVESHYWLFGEQYNLITSAEPDFEDALRKLILKITGKDEKVTIDHPDKNKEMDIFMIRQDRNGNVTENVVVELKRPTVNLGEEQVSQVKKYMRVVQSDPRFNSNNARWTFYLIGNKFDTTGYIEGELENNKNHGDNNLIYSAKNCKIYVLTWSTLFDDLSRKFEYLMNKLKFDKNLWINQQLSANEIVRSIKDNSASL